MNSTAPLTPAQHDRPRLLPAVHTGAARLQHSLRRHRWDDRPEMERNASPSEVAVRPFPRYGSPR